jgi:methionyl-tRNA formyltransferase
MHDEECEIHWPGHVDTIYNLIRACNPAPGAWMMLDGREGARVRLPQARGGRFVSRGHQPGDVAGVTEHSIVIWAQGGLVEILKLRPEGGGKVSRRRVRAPARPGYFDRLAVLGAAGFAGLTRAPGRSEPRHRPAGSS